MPQYTHFVITNRNIKQKMRYKLKTEHRNKLHFSLFILTITVLQYVINNQTNSHATMM